MADNCQTIDRHLDTICQTNQINQNITFIYINLFGSGLGLYEKC